MKPILLIFFLLALSSCLPVYRQLDGNNNPVATEAIIFPNCSINMSLGKRVRGDIADYHVYIVVKPLIRDMQFKAGDITVGLAAYPSGKTYQPVDIKILKEQPEGDHRRWVPPVPTAVEGSQIFDLKAGTMYTFVYSFSGHHRRKLKLDIAASVNGEIIKKSLILKKHTEVELLH